MRTAFEEYLEILRNCEDEGSLEKSNNYFRACVHLMDDELREKINSEVDDCSDEEFLEIYCNRHLEKFNEIFVVN